MYGTNELTELMITNNVMPRMPVGGSFELDDIIGSFKGLPELIINLLQESQTDPSIMIHNIALGAGLVGLVGLGVYVAKKAGEIAMFSDNFFMKYIVNQYKKKTRGNRDSRRGYKLRKFKDKMEKMFGDYQGEDQNAALRIVMNSIVKSDNPYDTLRKVKQRLTDNSVSGVEMIRSVSDVMPDGNEISEGYQERAQEDETFSFNYNHVLPGLEGLGFKPIKIEAKDL